MIIRSATPDDMDHVARLCWGYRDVLTERMSHAPGMVEKYYAKDAYAALIADLPRVHARPRGDILLAVLDAPVGCAMYYPIAPEVTEIKRIYVAPDGRGCGAAQALIVEAKRRAAADGYRRMVLDTADTLTEAITLYGKMGFTPCAPFYEPDPAFAPHLRFFDTALA